MARKLVLVLSFLLILTDSVFAVEKPQRYMPYPIVFVSGIGTKLDANTAMKGSPSHEWPDRRVFNELKKYFLIHPEVKTSIESKYEFEDKDIEKLKLQPGEKPILQFFFYDAQQATLATNADLLKDRINKILSPDGGYYKTNDYVYTKPCDTPKVILVCHSLGGLIARKMLVDNKDNIRDKIAAIFFIGTQQEGSPLGVIAYFLPKEIPELRKDIDNINTLIDGADRLRRRALLNVRQREESKITGNLELMRWAETEDEVPGFPLPGLYVSTRDSIDNAQLREALAGTGWLAFLENELPEVSEKGVVKGTLINSELANSYRHTFEAYSFNGPFGTGIGARVVRVVPPDDPLTPGDDPLTYKLSEGVFSNPAVDRNIGDINAHAIAGYYDAGLVLGFCAAANSLMGWDNFYTLDYSCIRNRFWESGDGFSNLASQEAIVPPANVHEIAATHTTTPLAFGELDLPATPNIILQAIDDAPVIESVRFVPSNLSRYPNPAYVIFKVKDYLLADIEIAYIYLAEYQSLSDLPTFHDPNTDTYKPYVKFGKDFLKERQDKKARVRDKDGNETYLYLYPGEFYITTNDISLIREGNYIYIKNPAQRETGCYIDLIQSFSWENRLVIIRVGYAGGNNYWDTAINRTYSQTRDAAYEDFRAFPIGIYQGGRMGIYGEGTCGYIPWNRNYQWFEAYIAMIYGEYRNIILDIEENRKIKSITAVITGDRVTAGYYDTTFGPDFDISIYRDTTNTWPPTLDSTGNILKFKFNTAALKTGYIFAVELTPEDINPNGNNVWLYKPDLLEYNCIPAGLVPEERKAYSQQGGIFLRPIIVTEDKPLP